ncbi:MAG: bifunctional glutamate N-acetyltransferase/amino-acid acetyltransferase ArgJ [Chloroflexi bacterium]|nr:bifunctional glutamate N-acetyltransferase/amino-acid acetyltransferase ArgJ [Chloroflexota bacterium]
MQRVEGEGVTAPQGYLAGSIAAGIKATAGRLDLGMLVSERPAAVAGTFTTSSFAAAPVLVSRERVARGRAVGVVFNSGCANACTGERGLSDARQMAELAARKVGAPAEVMLVASTGVIGVPLPMEKIVAGLERLELTRQGGPQAALSIMTTDSRPKLLAVEFEADGRRYRVGGMAKGAGMIHPNMATMLAFVTTDVAVEPSLLQRLLRQSVGASFNMISVDRDTSTNDSVYLFANGAAGGPMLAEGSPAAAAFSAALDVVCGYLAQAIAGDGEGATRLIEVEVRGAYTLADARAAARAVAGSNLVKAAIHGADPNWGRVLGAIGYSTAQVDPGRTSVALAGQVVAEGGVGVPFDRAAVRELLQTERVRIEVDLGLGDARALAWGCDLTEQYVVENSEYTT